MPQTTTNNINFDKKMFTWNEDRIWSLLNKRVYENTEVALCDWLLILKIVQYWKRNKHVSVL